MDDKEAAKSSLTDTIADAIVDLLRTVAHVTGEAVKLRIGLSLLFWLISFFLDINSGYFITFIFFIKAISRPINKELAKEIWNIMSRDNPSEMDPIIEFTMIAVVTLTNIFSTVAYMAIGHFELMFSLWRVLLFSKISWIALAASVAFMISLRGKVIYLAQFLGLKCLSGLDIIHQLAFYLTSRESKSSSTRYKYEELDPEKNEIRLVKITKTSPFSRPSYSLVKLELDQIFSGPINYDAISYTWDQQKRNVAFDGMDLETTINVQRILQQRASCLRTTYLWIDAVCINQKNIKEQSSQIALMGKIYSQGRRTLIWLENDSPKPSEIIIIKLIFTLLTLCKRYWEDAPVILNYISLFVIGPGKCQSMDRFLGHRYWGRAWVIQEIARGREVHILYGSQFLDWKQVAYSFGLMTQPPLYQYMNKNLIVDVARRLSTGEPGDSVKAMSATAIDSTKIPFLDKTKRVRSQGLLPLTAALEWSSASEATKPSDKIFALRGLVLHDSDLTSKMAYALRPDSSSSYTRVFTRVAKFLLSTDPEYLFRRAGVGFQRREPNDNTVLPSWVPDWTQQLSVIELEPQPYRAGGMGKFKADILDNGHICIPVIEICALVSLTEPMVPTAKNDSGMQTYFVKSALALFDSEPDIYLPQGQTRTEAFWRTIISNTVRRTPTTALQYPVPLNWNEKFESWKTSILDPDFDHVQNLQNFEPRGDRGQDFNLNFIVACQSRCFAISEGGYMVLVPELAKKGDKVCVIPGIGLPVVFRKNEKGDLWVYVGTCYVHGLMDGEAINLGRPVMDYVVV